MALSLQRRLLFGLVFAGMMLGVTEAVLRLVVPDDAWLMSWEREDGLLLYRSRTYVGGPVNPEERERWRRGELSLKAGTDTVQHDGQVPWAVRTNAQGLREDRPIPSGRLAERQFLALGDSWMFGVNAPQGQSLPSQLETLLPSALDVESVEVVNGGIPGANAWHMLRRWHYLRDRIAIDGLILGLPHNAPDPDVPALRRAWYQRARGLPAGQSRIYRGVRHLLSPYTRPHYPDLLSAEKDGDGKAMTLADLQTIISDARARYLPVWMVLWPNDMEAAQDTAMSLAQWVEPLSDGLDGHGGHALRDRNCWGSKDTWHPSAAGYTAIAGVVAEMIASNGKSMQLTPGPCTATSSPRPR